MSLDGLVVVTGPGGRLGRALVAALAETGVEVVGAGRPDYDLDEPSAGRRLIETRHPSTVIHAAAWTDVEGCARQPELATRRNATAVAELAEACAAAGARLILISTNEVFDGERANGRGYAEEDVPRPLNSYGASKLAGEQAALTAFAQAGASDQLWIVRTAWLFGPPGNDFPSKILAAAGQLAPGADLPVVSDEIGSPTYTIDIAPALIRLVVSAPAGVYHLAADGIASRYEVATEVLARCRPSIHAVPISRTDFGRESVAPAWAVLDTARATSFGVSLRHWRPAMTTYLGQVCPGGAQ